MQYREVELTLNLKKICTIVLKTCRLLMSIDLKLTMFVLNVSFPNCVSNDLVVMLYQPWLEVLSPAPTAWSSFISTGEPAMTEAPSTLSTASSSPARYWGCWIFWYNQHIQFMLEDERLCPVVLLSHLFKRFWYNMCETNTSGYSFFRITADLEEDRYIYIYIFYMYIFIYFFYKVKELYKDL